MIPEGKIVEFLRKRDYTLKSVLGEGATGKTVLLYDDIIDFYYVCKKYQPTKEREREQLFERFLDEVKLLHKISHPYVVRLYHYYLYPDDYAGFILMEYVDGSEIDDYISEHHEAIDDVFVKTMAGFKALEANRILHRDIRPQNIMVTSSGVPKIIDLGFGKLVSFFDGFSNSTSVSPRFPPPGEASDHVYNFATEVYYVGKLFETLVIENDIESFSHKSVLNKMIQSNPAKRFDSFFSASNALEANRLTVEEFDDNEIEAYRDFAGSLFSMLTKIETSTKYKDDIDRIQLQMESLYRSVMLEEFIPNVLSLTRCFLEGPYYVRKDVAVPTYELRRFIEIVRSISTTRRNIVFSNLWNKLDSIPRYSVDDDFPDDIPF